MFANKEGLSRPEAVSECECVPSQLTTRKHQRTYDNIRTDVCHAKADRLYKNVFSRERENQHIKVCIYGKPSALTSLFLVGCSQGIGTAKSLYMGHVLNAHEVTIQSVRLEAALWETGGAWMNIYLPKWLTRHLE